MRSTINFGCKLPENQTNASANENSMHLKFYPIKWEIDTTKSPIFSGFEAGYKKSEVTTGNRLYYDRSRPYKKTHSYLKSP
jgi:hypothetical protein